jgi:anthranilate synthase component 1
MITELEFKSLAAQGYNRIPLIAEAFADLETPLSLYLKLAGGQPNSFLLESVVGGERFGRYSFIGLPARTLAARHRPGHRGSHRRRRRRAPRRQPAGLHRRLPAAFQGRRCGPGCRASAAAWRATSATTRCAASSPGWPGPARPVAWTRPTSCCCRPRNWRSSTTSVGPAVPDRLGRPGPARGLLQRQAPAGELVTSCATASPRRRSSAGPATPWNASSRKADYLPRCAAAKEYIAAGDMMQVQIGQRLRRSATPRAR